MIIQNNDTTKKRAFLLDVCSTAFHDAEQGLLEFISDEDYYNAYKAAFHTLSVLEKKKALNKESTQESGLINNSWFCLKLMTSYLELISDSINNNEFLIKNYSTDSIECFADSIRSKFNQLFYKKFFLDVLIDYNKEDYRFTKLQLDDYNFLKKLRKRIKFLELSTRVINKGRLKTNALTRVFNSLLADNCFDFLESLELLEPIQDDEQRQLLALVNALQKKNSNDNDTLELLTDYLDNEAMESEELIESTKTLLLITRDRKVNERFISFFLETVIKHPYYSRVDFILNTVYELLEENFFIKEELFLITEALVRILNKDDYWMRSDSVIGNCLQPLLEQLASYGELDSFIEKTKRINGFSFKKEGKTVQVIVNCEYYNTKHGKSPLMNNLIDCLVDTFPFVNETTDEQKELINYELAFNKPELYRKEAVNAYQNFVKVITNNVILQNRKYAVARRVYLALLLLADDQTKKDFVSLVKKLNKHKAIHRIVFVSEYDQLYSNFWFVLNQIKKNL